MKMSTVIKEICYTDEEKTLFNAVIKQLTAKWSEVWERPEDFRTADSGVGGFIYYSDTEAFAKRQLVNILHCLNELEEDIGEPLKKDQNNLLNWYAWFALEYIIDKVMYYKEN